jgi:small GTP-binding protein
LDTRADLSAILIPLGTLRGHRDAINGIAFSPDGERIASTSQDSTLRIWWWEKDVAPLTIATTGHSYSASWAPDGTRIACATEGGVTIYDATSGYKTESLRKHVGNVYAVAWSPDGRRIATGGRDRTVIVWDAETGTPLSVYTAHEEQVNAVAWSPDSQLLASGSDEGVVRVLAGDKTHVLTASAEMVLSLAWSATGELLASTASEVICWNPAESWRARVLEGHRGWVSSVRTTPDGKLAFSKGQDGTIRVWAPATGEAIASISETASAAGFAGIDCSPCGSVVATLGDGGRSVSIWRLGEALLRGMRSAMPAGYANAKVVLLGDGGVGKTALLTALRGEPWQPTAPTHGSVVHVLPAEPEEGNVVRELTLWDLAGQPGYRLLHQIHLDDVAVAVVVFDHCTADSFESVAYWVRALRQAAKYRPEGSSRVARILVAARTDMPGVPLGRKQIDDVLESGSFDDFCTTSARKGTGIAALRAAIEKYVDWDAMTIVSSPEVLRALRAFIRVQADGGQLLVKEKELMQQFRATHATVADAADSLENAMSRLATMGQIRRLGFGNLILLQPQYIDVYAGAIINTALKESDGMASLAEHRLHDVALDLPVSERIADPSDERLLVIATAEDLLRREIAVRDTSDGASFLIFPAQSTRDRPSPAVEPDITFSFTGAASAVYATLVVRLSNSRLFERTDVWRGGAAFTDQWRGSYIVTLCDGGRGSASISVTMDKTSVQLREHFEQYVRTHIERRAAPGSVSSESSRRCAHCGERFPAEKVRRWLAGGVTRIVCPMNCGPIELADAAPLDLEALVHFDNEADHGRKVSLAQMNVKAKHAAGKFDVFLCHSSKDKDQIRRVAKQLEAASILPWLDDNEIRPGLSWLEALQQQIGSIASAAVFIGASGIAPWQELETEALLVQLARRRIPIIPVLLADAPSVPALPLILETLHWVDFRCAEPDPFDQLMYGITGVHPRLAAR